MQMHIEIDVQIPDAYAAAHDDGFGEPACTVSAVILELMRRQVVTTGLFEVDDETIVRTDIPSIQAVGIEYGKTRR